MTGEPTPELGDNRPSDRINPTTEKPDTSISGVDYWSFNKFDFTDSRITPKPEYDDRTIAAICSDENGLYVAWRKPAPAVSRIDPETDWCSATTEKGTRCLLDASRDGLCKLHWRKHNTTPLRRPGKRGKVPGVDTSEA